MYEELKIQHVAGPLEVHLSTDEATVLCVVRNGETYVDEFVDHYKSMGFSHIAFLDNGSDDATMVKASRHRNVTVLLSRASYKKEKLGMKHALMRLFGSGTWSLTVDIDEFFQYPFMDQLPLNAFIRYLNEHEYTSVVAQLVDMVPNATFGEILREGIMSIRCNDWFFNCTTIEKRPYHVRTNEASNPEIRQWYGGIRGALFGLTDVYLTKHPMNFGDGRLILFNGHEIGNRRVADIAGILLHYKYLGDVHSHIKRAVAERNYFNFSKEYRVYLTKFQDCPDTSFIQPGSVRYEDHRTLVEHDMFTVSDRYLEYISRVNPRQA